MEKQHYPNNKGFSFIEIIGVLFIVCIIISILSFNPISSYKKYKERLAVNELVTDMYALQTKSNITNNTYINYLSDKNEYIIYDGDSVKTRNIKENGKVITNSKNIKFMYKNGNVNIAKKFLVDFENSRYEITVYLETGYINVNEK